MPTDPILPRPYFDGKVTTIHDLFSLNGNLEIKRSIHEILFWYLLFAFFTKSEEFISCISCTKEELLHSDIFLFIGSLHD